MHKTRVLIIDDAVVVRRVLTSIISEAEGLEVVGSAPNGRVGLEKIEALKPDIVTLDVEMPEMNGLEALDEIRKRYPRLPVIMFSTLTQRGAATTIDALSRGASDYVTKPENTVGIVDATQQLKAQLIPKINGLAQRQGFDAGRGSSTAGGPEGRNPAVPLTATTNPIGSSAARAARHKPVEVVAIGVSTGGPQALSIVLPQLPVPFPVPVLVVQHMPPMFTKLLAERLSLQTPMPVVEVEAGQEIVAGKIYLAPGDRHLGLQRTAQGIFARLNQDPPENSCRPSVDVTFRDVAKLWGAAALAVILTGMGQDGLLGTEAIVKAGGRAIAQDAATSVVWGMPGAVSRAGLIERELPLPAIGTEIMRVVQRRLSQSSLALAGREA